MIDKEIKLEEILKSIVPADMEWIEKAREHTAQLVMPPRALGRLHDISERICGIYKDFSPSLDKKAVLVMAGDHGVVDEYQRVVLAPRCLFPGTVCPVRVQNKSGVTFRPIPLDP